ncbi:thermonuclease family protein [Pedobacter miscanthi]|uniref:thermonuclease family protein n=1 Tax=Pedobacter miscanthi TaxID=2259170 RepID=UPI002930DCB1|nr:thermonuclease family protein [Pedobacter miscanthi]
MRLGKVGLLVLLLTLQACIIQPGEGKPLNYSNLVFTAKVIRILDGDTMEVLYQEHPLKIRLAHIDCPEKRGHQPFGTEAKQALSNLCFGQMVTVQGQKYDRYKRLIAVVINDKKQVINQEMIKLGMAWHFKKYSSDPLYAQLEINARKNKIGLWQDMTAIAPWEWRKPQKQLLSK